MGKYLTVVRMVAQRALGHWRLLITLAAGVVLSVALMASVFLYSDAVRDLGLTHALDTTPTTSLDVRIDTSTGRVVPSVYGSRRATLDGLVARYAAPFTSKAEHYGVSSSFNLAAPGQPAPTADDRPRAELEFQDGFAAHTRIVAGRPPSPVPPAAQGTAPAIEVLVAKAWAEAQHATLGQQFALYPWWVDDPVPVTVTISGFVEPIDPGDPYWAGTSDRFVSPSTSYPVWLLWSDEATVVRTLGAFLPGMEVRLEARLPIERGRIDSRNAEEVRNRVAGLRQALNENIPLSSMETVLAETLHAYQDRLFFTRLPLFALMIQIVGIVLLSVVIAGTMVVERQRGEIALLKSRGASTAQVLAVFGLEAAGICFAALPLGIGVAVGSIALLGLTPPFHDLSDGGLLRVTMSRGALGLGATGAALAFLALLWPAYRASRATIAQYKQQVSRPPPQPAFLRYYGDLVVVGVAAFAFYELRERGSLVTDRLFGGLSADPLLLATPSLFILAVAIAFLRLFPLALRVVAVAARRLNGPTVSLGLTRMVRSPAQHSRLILLLILTTAVGVFAAGFRATLDGGYADRAAYTAGAELRVAGIRRPLGTDPGLLATVESATGASQGTPVVRTDGRVDRGRGATVDPAVLGVRAADFADYAAWRGDFAAESLGSLLGRLRLPAASPAQPLEVRQGSGFIGVWANSTARADSLTFEIRLRRDDGIVADYQLKTEDSAPTGEWRFYSADLTHPVEPLPPADRPPGQLRVDQVFVRLNPQGFGPASVLQLDDLQVSALASLPAGWGQSGFPGGTVIEPFDDLAPYETITGVGGGNPGEITRGTATAGRSGQVARIVFAGGRGGSPVVGLRRVTDARPVPVIADAGFLPAVGRREGEPFPLTLNSQTFLAVTVGTVDLFPGFDPATGRHLLVADLEQLQEAATRAPAGNDNLFANEAWLGGPRIPDLTPAMLASHGLVADTVVDRESVRRTQATDPLIAASWEGILFLSFASVLLLSTVCFVTFAALSAQARSLEFAILRTMGFSGRQILGMVSFEQWFVIVAGVAAGTVLGFPLGRLMIQYLGIDEQGRAALPPLISRVGWETVLTVYVLLGIVVAATVAGLVALYARLAVSRALRMGEL